jgi:MoaD family protein
MSVKVRVPTQLRNFTGESGEVEASGLTVAELIEDLNARHPGIKNRLLDDSGAIRRFVNVYVNDEDVRFLNGLATEVPEGAQLSIIPAVAGG